MKNKHFKKQILLHLYEKIRIYSKKSKCFFIHRGIFYMQNMSFEDESEGLQRCWPVNIMFDPRPEYNGHVYLSLSSEKTWIYTRYVYRYDTKNLDAICK